MRNRRAFLLAGLAALAFPLRRGLAQPPPPGAYPPGAYPPGPYPGHPPGPPPPHSSAAAAIRPAADAAAALRGEAASAPWALPVALGSRPLALERASLGVGVGPLALLNRD